MQSPLVYQFLLSAILLSVAPARWALRRSVDKALDTAYPGWRFATIAPSLRAQLARGQRPEWVRGDFDGDGRTDYAVQLVRPAGSRDSVQLTVALLTRGRARYALHIVQAGGIHQDIWLARGPRGQRSRDLAVDTAFVYRTDAVEIGFGQEAGETCLFLSGNFRCYVTGD